MRALLFAALLPVAAIACPPLLDHQLRPLASRDTVHLCERFEGQVLLVVNTASKCGFTPQYEGLEALHQRYAAQGFAVVGFPSGDFMGQEFEDEAEIAEFCTSNYGVQFPMFQKISVRQGSAHPLFSALAEAAGQYPQWNFHKYLVGRDGTVIGSFGSRVRPDAPELIQAIEGALAVGG